MMRDRITAEQRLSDKVYTWREITFLTTSLLLIGVFTSLIIFEITKVN